MADVVLFAAVFFAGAAFGGFCCLLAVRGRPPCSLGGGGVQGPAGVPAPLSSAAHTPTVVKRVEGIPSEFYWRAGAGS
jgi:hypothetical protein